MEAIFAVLQEGLTHLQNRQHCLRGYVQENWCCSNILAQELHVELKCLLDAIPAHSGTKGESYNDLLPPWQFACQFVELLPL